MADDKTRLESARAHVLDRMTALKGEMQKASPSPVGTRARTPREQAALWKKLNGLQKDELQAVMVSMATQAGHQDGEPVPCEVCRFVADQVLKDVKRN